MEPLAMASKSVPQSKSPLQQFCLDYLAKNRKAKYQELRDAGLKAGFSNILPVNYGKAQAQLGIVKSFMHGGHTGATGRAQQKRSDIAAASVSSSDPDGGTRIMAPSPSPIGDIAGAIQRLERERDVLLNTVRQIRALLNGADADLNGKA